MQDDDAIAEVREVFQRFQEGYTARDPSRMDEFMNLFVPSEEAELIGIGASVRGGSEWFQGPEAIREIIESDWTYWGDVILDWPFVFTAVVVRDQGGWRFHTIHWSMPVD